MLQAEVSVPSGGELAVACHFPDVAAPHMQLRQMTQQWQKLSRLASF